MDQNKSKEWRDPVQWVGEFGRKSTKANRSFIQLKADHSELETRCKLIGQTYQNEWKQNGQNTKNYNNRIWISLFNQKQGLCTFKNRENNNKKKNICLNSAHTKIPTVWFKKDPFMGRFFMENLIKTQPQHQSIIQHSLNRL